MKEEFEKAMAEQIDKTHWDSWSYEVGAHWAYEWLTNEHHQFALHRSWVNKCKNIEAKLAIATKALEKIADPNNLQCDPFGAAEKALEEIKGSECQK